MKGSIAVRNKQKEIPTDTQQIYLTGDDVVSYDECFTPPKPDVLYCSDSILNLASGFNQWLGYKAYEPRNAHSG